MLFNENLLAHETFAYISWARLSRSELRSASTEAQDG